MIRLSALFQDGMILQRGQENLLWGYAKENSKIEGSFAIEKFTTITDEKGYFQVVLPKKDCGGPYELKIKDTTEEECHIKDILVGDVFLLGGQSNMELPINRVLDLYEAEIENVNEPFIRMFEVPKEYLFGDKQEDVTGGKWIRAVGEETLAFSAAGFFMAQAVRKEQEVPIGLLQTAVGGTPVKAWCSEESLRKIGGFEEELDLCRAASFVEKTIEEDINREAVWHGQAKQEMNEDVVYEQEIQVPGMWNGTQLESFHGSLLLQKKVILSQEQSQQEAMLRLGVLVDKDRVYVNGTLVGQTEYRYPPRYYKIPTGLLKVGENVIEIEFSVCRGPGGFVPDKKCELRFENTLRSSIDLSGTWKYANCKVLPRLAEPTFFQYKAAGLYNGMIYPIRKWKISGYLYYQGESDANNWKGYEKRLTQMIADWRTLWKQEKLPFIYVQLAGFSDGKWPCITTDWAYLREEQRKVLEVNDTTMIVAFDVGEYNELHPIDKKTLGERLALGVRRSIYGEEVQASGPMYKGIEKRKNEVKVIFDNTGKGLRIGRFADSIEKTLNGFEVCDKSKNYVPALAVIEGDGVLLSSHQIEEIQGIRYAWSDAPMDSNLYNIEGLPACPFIIED
jgi:Domain of unknown function (DUF303).